GSSPPPSSTASSTTPSPSTSAAIPIGSRTSSRPASCGPPRPRSEPRGGHYSLPTSEHFWLPVDSETVPFDFLVLLKRTIRIIRAAWGDLDAPVLLRQLVVFTTFQTLVRAHGEPWESRPHGTLKNRAGGKNRQSFGKTRLPMRTFAQKPKAPQQAIPTKPTILDRTHFGHSHEVNSLLRLQRTIGNQAVQRLVQANAEELSPGSATTTSTRFTQDFSRVLIPP